MLNILQSQKLEGALGARTFNWCDNGPLATPAAPPLDVDTGKFTLPGHSNLATWKQCAFTELCDIREDFICEARRRQFSWKGHNYSESIWILKGLSFMQLCCTINSTKVSAPFPLKMRCCNRIHHSRRHSNSEQILRSRSFCTIQY
jgi:hypothetical protein